MKNKKPKLTDSEFIYDLKLINYRHLKGEYTTKEAKDYIMSEIGVYLKSL